jgi:hypothetical protein
MKKTIDERKKTIVLDYLNTKFKGKNLEVKVSPHNPNYIMYYLGTTMILNAWKYSEKSNFRANFGDRFLDEFIRWFPKFKYKRRVLRDWLFTNYDIKLPEGCVLYVP